MVNFDDTLLWLLLRLLAAQIPEMVGMLVGMIVSISQWKRHPRMALLGFLGFATMLLASFGGITFHFLARMWFPDWFAGSQIAGLIPWAVRSLLMGVGCVLLLWAVFSSRRPAVVYPQENRSRG